MGFTLVGLFVASFIVTSMVSQLFPDDRFPLSTLVLVMLAATAGAWVGHQNMGGSLISGSLLGAGVVSSLLLYIFHRTGFLTQTPLPSATDEDVTT